MNVKRKLSPTQKFLLKRFVNRKNELKRFREMLEGDDHMVMFVTGESDVGKSTFMARMIEECGVSEWNCAVVACDRMANNDYRTIMRKLRSEIGRDQFETTSNELKDLIESDFQRLIDELDKAGAPWTSGRPLPRIP